jgi:Host cell surface-exposed lipoprotein
MSETTQYKPGDIANGHVLDSEGTWQPLPPAPPEKKKRKGWKILGYAVAGIIGISVIANMGGGDDESDKAEPNQVASQTEAKQAPADKTEPKAEKPAPVEESPAEEAPQPAPEPEFTMAQEQAIASAEDYLEFSAFSEKGLIDQLSSEYGEGFSKADATFAVSHIDVDWNEQAAKAAKNYLEFDSFSRQGLIDQLESPYGDQFTHAQAVYGVNQTGL